MNSKFALLEAALFASGVDGLSVFDLKKAFEDLNAEDIRDMVNEYTKKLELDHNSGLNVVVHGGRYKIMTKPELYDNLAKLVEIKQVKPLRQSIMETLSIVAYNQPCTRKRVDEVRGTNNVWTIDSLLMKGLIEETGRETTPGNPILYSVSQKFFDLFGIKSIKDLPKIDKSATIIPDADLFDIERYPTQTEAEYN